MFAPNEVQTALLELLRSGMSNRAIAAELNISVAGVEYHLHRLFKATGARNRVALVMWWLDHRSKMAEDSSRTG